MNPVSFQTFLGILGLIACGILGIAAHTLINIRGLRRQTANLVTEVSLKSYFQKEWDNIGLSFLALLILGVGWTQFVQHATVFNPKIGILVINLSRYCFVFVGLAGDYIILNIWGRTPKIVNKEIACIASSYGVDKQADVSTQTLPKQTNP